MGSPETWRWIWLAVAAGLSVGEITLAGSFYLAPLAVGAALAAVTAFAGLPVAAGWVAFVAGSVAAFVGLRPLARHLDSRGPRAPVGADRWVNREALVITPIGAGTGGTGTIRLDREEWRAESLTGEAIPAGSTVLVTRVDGTRLVVLPVAGPEPLPSEGVT